MPHLQNVYLSPNFDSGDLRSDQFCDTLISKSVGENSQYSSALQIHPNKPNSFSFFTVLDDLRESFDWWQLRRPPRSLRGYFRSWILFCKYLLIEKRCTHADGLTAFRSSKRIDWYATWPILVTSRPNRSKAVFVLKGIIRPFPKLGLFSGKGRQSRLMAWCGAFCLKIALLANARPSKLISLPAETCTEQIASTCTKSS